MKVEGPGKSKSVSSTKKTGKSSNSGETGKFSGLLTSKASDAEENAAVSSIAQVNNLLSVQAAEDPAEQEARQRMAKRAHSILDELDNIKVALLNGNLRFSHLEAISQMVSQNRERVSDPTLTHLLDEVDMRAQIEIAKLEAARDAALQQLKAG